MNDDEGAARRRPFPGLRPFEDKDEFLFFGRDDQIDALLLRLQHLHFVAVVGTSASGKSSLVRAGLLPALHGGFMASAGSRWRIATLRPESDPIGSLAGALERCGALGSAGDAPTRAGLARAVLERGALGLVEIVRQSRDDTSENVLIFVDQFEELFRFKRSASTSESADEAAAFVKLLLAAAQTEANVYVLITMRSDFLGDCSQFAGLPETINDGLFLVPRLSREQLRDAIVGPVGVEEAEIAPRLVNRLLGDLADDPDQLPVLQHALMRTWDLWEAKGTPAIPIDLDEYDATGGLSEALSRHGDEIYAALPERLRAAAERIFKALTDAGSENRGIRRPTRFATLVAIAGVSAADARDVIDAYRARGVSFLMPSADVPLADDTTIDITHESLMRIWTRLRAWVAEEAESARAYLRLREAAAMHARGEAGLLRDEAQLAAAREWRERERPTAVWAERYAPGFDQAMRFLDASVAARERERAQRAFRLRSTLAALSIALIVFGVISAFAIKKNLDAQHELQAAESERIARVDRQLYEQSAENMSESNPLSLELKRATYLLAPGAYAESATADAAEMLLLGITHQGVGYDVTAPNLALASIELPEWHLGALDDAGRQIAVVTGKRAHLHDVVTGRLIGFDLHDLNVDASLDRVAASGLCGFDDARALATTDGAGITTYDLTAAQPTALRTTPLARVLAIACGPARTVFAATGDGKLVRVTSDGVIHDIGSFPRGDLSGLSLSADATWAAVVACAPASKLACAPKAVYVFSTGGTARPVAFALRDLGMDCGIFECAQAVTFDATRAFFYDAGALHVWTLGSRDAPILVGCPTKYCARAAIAMVPGIVTPIVVAANKTVSVYFPNERRYDFIKIRYDTVEPIPPLPLIDRHDAVFASNDGGTFGTTFGLGLGLHSLSDFVNAPMRSLVPSGAWGFALAGGTAGSALAIPRKAGIDTVDLEHTIGANAAAFDPTNDPWTLIGDGGDGTHAVTLNLHTGVVTLYDLGAAPKVTGTFGVDVAALAITPQIARLFATNPSGAISTLQKLPVSPQIVLDPTSGTITIASNTNLMRYATDGRRLSNLRWQDFLARAKLADLGTPSDVELSGRGNDVMVRYAKAADALVSVDGALIGRDNNVSAVSPDERYAIARTPNDLHVLYSIPQWKPQTIDITRPFEAVAISPDSRTLAYATQESKPDAKTGKPAKVWEIRLYDIASRHSTAASLPLPIDSDDLKIFKVRFSQTGRYLIVTGTVSGDAALAVYDVDPSSWQRSVCLEAGTPLDEAQFHDIVGESISYRNGCADLQPFAGDAPAR